MIYIITAVIAAVITIILALRSKEEIYAVPDEWLQREKKLE